MRRVLGPTLVAVLILLATTPHSPRAQAYGARSLIPRTYADVRAFSAQIDAMLRAGRMQPIARSSADTMLPWRTHDRFQQVYRGVPVVGDYTDALLPSTQFYDTIYHLTTESARARSERLARQLAPYLGDGRSQLPN